MVKSELDHRLAMQQDDLSLKEVARGTKHLLKRMSATLAQGERVEIRDFGSFDIRYYPPRRAHNPKTREHITATAAYTVYFKPGKGLLYRINHSKSYLNRSSH